MSNWRKVMTTADVFRAIRGAHQELVCFSSYSNPNGNDGMSSVPEMMTEFGFRGHDFPIIGARSFGDGLAQNEYWLCVGVEEDQ